MSKHEERRRTPRRPIVSSFSLYAVVPQKGAHRLLVHDLSELGVLFDYDIEGESPSDEISDGEKLDFQLYINQSLYIPMVVTVVRTTTKGNVRSIGAEFDLEASTGKKALKQFVGMLDELIGMGLFES